VRAIGKDLRQYQAVSAGLFVMSPTLLSALDSCRAIADQGVAAAAERARSRPTTSAQALARRGFHRPWSTRLGGEREDWRSTSMPALCTPHAGDTLALIERCWRSSADSRVGDMTNRHRAHRLVLAQVLADGAHGVARQRDFGGVVDVEDPRQIAVDAQQSPIGGERRRDQIAQQRGRGDSDGHDQQGPLGEKWSRRLHRKPVGLSQPGLSKKVILRFNTGASRVDSPIARRSSSPRHPTVMAIWRIPSASSSASVRSISVVSPTMARQLGPG